MHRLLRLVCVGLAVTLVVAMQGAGVSQAQHRVSHALEFPGVSYANAPEDHAHEDHGHDHDSAPDTADSLDAAAGEDSDAPLTHHHHSGGDIHVALTSPPHPADALHARPVNAGPGAGILPPGAHGDGPLHPPKQHA
ncbi:hypothetical protein RSD66_12280 [Brevundimonas sp. S1H14]|uniref:hypothetical protein n=1 Tax=Brevundimonas sp. S1H14 TaxID=3078084 RepID=UPI0004AF8257